MKSKDKTPDQTMTPPDTGIQRPRILFIGNQNSSFVHDDFKLLSSHYPVTALSLTQQGHPVRALPRFILTTLASLKKADLVFCWFANLESFLPIFFGKLLHKKTIVVAGGYDCANEPALKYGSFAHPLKRRLARFIFNHADLVLAVSHFTEREALGCTHPHQIKIIYNGLDVEKFSPGTHEKEPIILTVSRVDQLNVRLKGLKIFAEASAAFPSYQAIIIGPTEEPWKTELLSINPALIFTGGLPHDELVPWFRRARIYCQLSYRESFGLALVEAMSCGCLPITTDRGALPEVAGDCGITVPYDDVSATKAALAQAVQKTSGYQPSCRERVVNHFSLSVRDHELCKAIDSLHL